MKRMKQTDVVLSYLKRNGELTTREAVIDLNIMCLPKRIEELRMQGAAKDLQIRMKKIEEQLVFLQRLTNENIDLSDMPTREEINRLSEAEQKAADAAELIVKGDVEGAQSRFNKRHEKNPRQAPTEE